MTSTVVYDANATDDGEDTNTITYSLTGDDAALFNIDSSTGEVTFAASPNFEAPADLDADNDYEVTVHANDGLNDTTRDVTISVTDVNDNSPVFSSGTTASAAENVSTSAVVYDANATDADGTAPNNTITYSLTGDDAALFNIDSSTGEVTFAASPDFEAPADLDADNDYEVTVHANDGLNDTTRDVTISVTDVNAAPSFTSGTTASAAENVLTSTVVYDANATDDGEDTNTITYSLTGDDAALFNIDSSTGEVTFAASPNFEAPADLDADNDYEVTVHANDGLNDTTRDVTISVTDVNDNSPVFSSGTTASAAENVSTSAVVYDANATDADGTAPNNTITYSLTGDDAALFNIDSSTGEVTFAASPDFEAPGDLDADNDYEVTVHANDGLNDTTRDVTISVTDQNDIAPVFSSGTTASTAENILTSTVVYDADASDADGTPANNTITYTLTGDDAALFNIDSSTGEVTFAASPDFEAPGDLDADNDYEVTVHANDGLNDTTRDVTISVTDVNAAPSFTSGTTASAAENVLTSTVVYDANATDDGEDTNTITYSLTGDDAALFNIDFSTGEVTFAASPNFEAPADLDADNDYEVTVHANDGLNDTTRDVTISVTDVNAAPSFTSGTTASAAENVLTSTVVYDANATDDGEDTNTITYSLTGDDAALFNIDSSTGEVTFAASPNFEAPADLDADNDYEVTVHANDGLNDTTRDVTISVTDVNDNSPVFSSGTTASAAENVSTSAVVYDANATDADGTAPNNTITYSLTGDDAALFNIDSSTGEVTFAASPDFEAPGDLDADNDYEVTVHANDGLNDTTRDVTISITDLDEIAPNAPSIDFVVDDVVPTTGNVTNGGKTNDNTPTIRVSFDASALEGDRVQLYNGASALGAAIFLSASDVSNGFIDITPAALVDDDYDLSATIIDQADNASVASNHFTMEVDTDAGAAPTGFTLTPSAVAENSANGTVVGTVTVTDPDALDTFTFSLLDDGDGHFAIDANTGVVTVVGPIDFEVDPTLAIEVLVTDSDDNTFSNTVVIDITDVDGVTIKGSTKNDTINATKTVKHQPLPTNEEDTINGGAGNDKISSLGGNDFVKGGAGNDKLVGGDGDDVLKGGSGNDKLTDGLGIDTLTGNAGVDKFIFSQFVDDASLATLGTITDFKHSQLDKIDLHLIDADSGLANNQAFHFIGNDAGFTNTAGDLRFVAATHTLEGDTDGDGTADFAIVLTNINHLVKGDFIL